MTKYILAKVGQKIGNKKVLLLYKKDHHTYINYICDCGHKGSARNDNLYKYPGCNYCKKGARARKYNIGDEINGRTLIGYDEKKHKYKCKCIKCNKITIYSSHNMLTSKCKCIATARKNREKKYNVGDIIRGKKLIGFKKNSYIFQCLKCKNISITHPYTIIHSKHDCINCYSPCYSYIGKKLFHLTIIGYNKNSRMFTCRCDCGKLIKIDYNSVTRSIRKSCGCKRKLDKNMFKSLLKNNENQTHS